MKVEAFYIDPETEEEVSPEVRELVGEIGILADEVQVDQEIPDPFSFHKKPDRGDVCGAMLWSFIGLTILILMILAAIGCPDSLNDV